MTRALEVDSHHTATTWGMMLARLACMTRAYRALVGPLVTRSMTPIRSGRRGGPQGKRPTIIHNGDAARKPGSAHAGRLRRELALRRRPACGFGDLPTAAHRGLSEPPPGGAARYGTQPRERGRGRARADEAYGCRGTCVALVSL